MYSTTRRLNHGARKLLSTQPARSTYYSPISVRRTFASESKSKNDDLVQDTGSGISDRDADNRGYTGGGEALNSTARGAPEPPKVDSFSLPNKKQDQNLSKEEREEVEEHNRRFYESHEKTKDNGKSGQKE